MTTPTTPEPEPERPAALQRRNQILAIIAILLAASVPIAMGFGIDVCAPLEAVGVHLDACEPDVQPAPEPVAPSPGAPGDGGRP